ncbi:hypothetical protein GCM10023196_107510 [Actinoallomurus vinaceus]|uniref:HTH cro/C1-type domain-containing protein n=1 Tax=Actinoallomurus vinaceus TaxID=1080074 RepID=A0ABP8UVQ5_9ACTN
MNPITVPASLWQRPETLDALRNRDIGRVFRLVQQYTGASQTQIAAACDTTQGKVSRYMSGVAQVEKLDRFEAIADGLDMTDEARMSLGVLSREVGDAAGGWLAFQRGVSAVVIVGM